MTPIDTYNEAWGRCDHLSVMHAYLAANGTQALFPDEILRAEWVARVAALDLYIHELVAQRVLEIFAGNRAPSNGFLRHQTANNNVLAILSGQNRIDTLSALDLEIRAKLGFVSYQDPDKIADGVRLFSDVELWNEIALLKGATPQTKPTVAKQIKRSLSLIVERRNKIAHEGDLQPGQPRTPWAIDQSDLVIVRSTIQDIVSGIDQLTN